MNPFIDADLCVKCGLCLPHCPTYQQTLDENESPRGRIALIQGLASGQLESTPTLQKHLDQCLLCRACEKACPAFVPYGQLMDRYRAQLTTPERKPHRKLQALLSNKTQLHRLATLLKLYKRSGISWLLRTSGFLKLTGLARFDALLPSMKQVKPPMDNESVGEKEVSLFVGCMGRLLDEPTVAAAKQLLNRLGFKVVTPELQNCCGAIALHDGERAVANGLADQNRQAFSGQQVVVTLASGCGATLRDYTTDFPESEMEQDFSEKVTDISHFLFNNWPEEGLLKPFPKTVYIQSPCSLKNVMKQAAAVEPLLAKIPQLILHKERDPQQCCGAAGRYLLDHPKMASQLAEPLIDQIERLEPDYLVSSNIGCAIHLRAAIVARGLKAEVVHPIVLLEKALL
jgi:glycolate oxidase iron-sulfur subunit